VNHPGAFIGCLIMAQLHLDRGRRFFYCLWVVAAIVFLVVP
jgi:hypothetical protein